MFVFRSSVWSIGRVPVQKCTVLSWFLRVMKKNLLTMWLESFLFRWWVCFGLFVPTLLSVRWSVSLYESVNDLVSWVSQSLSQSLRRSARQLVGESVGQSLNQPVSQSLYESASQTISWLLKQSVSGESVSQSFCQSVCDSMISWTVDVWDLWARLKYVCKKVQDIYPAT